METPGWRGGSVATILAETDWAVDCVASGAGCALRSAAAVAAAGAGVSVAGAAVGGTCVAVGGAGVGGTEVAVAGGGWVAAGLGVFVGVGVACAGAAQPALTSARASRTIKPARVNRRVRCELFTWNLRSLDVSRRGSAS